MLVFSDTSANTGIVQQVRDLMRVDSTQWPTSRIVNSCNNYLDTITGYAIGADRRFQFDSTNHSKLPIGTTALVSGQETYSFLTDEQGNKILNLVSISLVEISTNKETPLKVIDIAESSYNYASFGVDSGLPTRYDKIADNIVKLDFKPTDSDASLYKLKFYFQRTPYYYVAADTTRESGMPPLLDRGFVINAAFDGALSLGLENLQPLSVERQLEEKKMTEYFANRNTDEVLRMTPVHRNYE